MKPICVLPLFTARPSSARRKEQDMRPQSALSIKQFVREAMQCCLQLEDLMPLIDEPKEVHVSSIHCKRNLELIVVVDSLVLWLVLHRSTRRRT